VRRTVVSVGAASAHHGWGSYDATKVFTINAPVETLTWAARGKTSAEIAKLLDLSKRTVDFHIENARTKLGVSTRIQAAVKAATGRLIEP